MKRYLLLEIASDGPMTVDPTKGCARDANGTEWYGPWDGRVISESDIGQNQGGDLIKALAVAVHRDAAVAAITGGATHENSDS